MVSNHTRRKVVIGTGAITLGTLGTIWHTQEATAATIEATELDIPDHDHAGELEELIIEIDAEISYESELMPDEIVLKGHAGEPNSLYELTEETISIDQASADTVSTSLEMNVLESMSLGVGSFELLTGMSERNQDVQIKLEAILKESGQTLAEAETTETATVTVFENNAEISVSATGEWNAN